MITLSTATFDPSGYIEIEALPSTTAGDASRRVSRVATLDGGAVVNDFGFSDADRVISLKWSPVLATDVAVKRLLELYQTVQVATRDGVFLAAPESFTARPTESTLRLLVLERLST
ncbi:MAG: hypothetical protein RLZZ524_653 [Pseudomonadota bacterium]